MIHMRCARRSTRCGDVFLLSHDLSQVRRKGDLGDEVDNMQRKRRRCLQLVPEAFERCRCAHDVHSCFLCRTFFHFTICFHLCNVVFTGAPGAPGLRSAADTAEGANFVIFDGAFDSTGGVMDEKGLWLSCQSTGICTGGRAHGPTAMLFFLLNSLMSSLSSCR